MEIEAADEVLLRGTAGEDADGGGAGRALVEQAGAGAGHHHAHTGERVQRRGSGDRLLLRRHQLRRGDELVGKQEGDAEGEQSTSEVACATVRRCSQTARNNSAGGTCSRWAGSIVSPGCVACISVVCIDPLP